MGSGAVLRPCDATEFSRCISDLSRLLHDCVRDGASIGFIEPFNMADAEAFWREAVYPGVKTGERTVFCVWIDGELAGTGQLVQAAMPNQTHRADVSKVMTSPAFRRRGVARMIMSAIETCAIERKLRLLTLDTRTGDAAEPLYRELGFETAGIIPDYAQDVFSDRLDATTFMYKRLSSHPI